jgi:DNA polymerase epsilon subunit 1
VDHNGESFKTTLLHRPYFYLLTRREDENLGQLLVRKFEGSLLDAQLVPMVDLDMPNHLSPDNLTRKVWKLLFDNVSQLMDVRKQLTELIKTNASKGEGTTTDSILHAAGQYAGPDRFASMSVADSWSNLQELREYDVPYTVRVCMDLNIRAGTWYTVSLEYQEGGPPIPHLSDPDIETKGTPKVLAFDIECSKAPLKFPNADVDEIYMISYMVSDGKEDPLGYLITSRSIVSEDIEDFNYTPKPSYPGVFRIFNEQDEEATIRRFVDEYKRHRPQIVVTYNGDNFDWPYVMARAKYHGIDVWNEIGISQNGDDEVRGRCTVHLDCFAWVQRDSYLPQGAQGLKAVTKYKLGYEPEDVDAEDMLPMAKENPKGMAKYSVSDAVATYYLYEKYVHLFIFSLCTLIPMGPEDVLRKGSGTLCEALLMVQANDLHIICPNKQIDPLAKFHKGHLLESETYIGGKVECLETGVYRSDIEYDFDLKPSAFQQLIDNIDRDLSFAIEVEAGVDRSEIVNYEDVRSKIIEQLEHLRDRPKRKEKPYVYHLDVGAMYPNIILTNRLQPSAIVDDATCAACDFNQSKNGCKRRMDWVWRGDYSPAGKLEYERTKDQLQREVQAGDQHFNELPEKNQANLIASRLKDYSRNVYRRTKITEEITRKDTVCMRENDFYVETVRRFRDRRYDYKKMTKSWKKKIGSAPDAAAKKYAEDKTLVYDSLQVAHKCILNSFYGYVMRKGARWRSMEMAGIVTKTGADLITQARKLVEQIGRPLELDTDGIWCILPASFPDVYSFETKEGSKVKLEYPCVMLNADVHDNFSNHQYQTLKDENRGIYESRSECSIFFEVDGPYRCMVLPASTEENKLLKKRYAVFDFDGSLSELKGFELKRRGELELIKKFQSEVFDRFLDGTTLAECYQSVGQVAIRWLDVIYSKGKDLSDAQLFELISENKNMSRQLSDYGGQKGTSQTTARRLGEFLGAEVIKDKGLNCKFIISERPYGAPVTERAIPTTIWQAEPEVKMHFLKKWLKLTAEKKGEKVKDEDLDIRKILDWNYYEKRLGSTIQKIITIPAALQKVENPVPSLDHPDWLEKAVRRLNNKYQQRSITSMFSSNSSAPRPATETQVIETQPEPMDIEDFGVTSSNSSKRPMVHSSRRRVQDEGGAVQSNPSAEGVAEPEEERLELNKENFSSWLTQKKSSWRDRRLQRRAAARSAGREPKDARTGMESLEGFARNAAREATRNLTKKEWQIIEFREVNIADTQNGEKVSSGAFVAWVLAGGKTLQRVVISVPRIVYVSTRCAIDSASPEVQIRRVEKHLPHSKTAKFLYEVSMSENFYRKEDWVDSMKRSAPSSNGSTSVDIDQIYETATPLLMRALTELGSVSKLSHSAQSRKLDSFSLSDLKRVDRPTEGPYLDSKLLRRRAFLYVRLSPKTRAGVVALFSVDKEQIDCDITAPSDGEAGSFDISASCQLWIWNQSGKQTIETDSCERVFSQLLQTVRDTADLDSEYSCISPTSVCTLTKTEFLKNEEKLFDGVSKAIASFTRFSNNNCMLVTNTNRPLAVLRPRVPALNNLPVVPLPFPPGPDHSPSMANLPSLNWELPAVQLSFEAYLYMGIISYPKRVAFSRYGNLPIGNLGDDVDFTIYEVSLARTLQTNRALSWASPVCGAPDLGAPLLASGDGKLRPSVQGAVNSTVDVWGDNDELVSPVVRKPGCYRTVCVDIDVHDLAVAALTDTAALGSSATGPRPDTKDPSSPNSVLQLGNGNRADAENSEPLGDEMSMSTALPMLRALVGAWLKDAFTANNEIADSMLHHVYRLVSNPYTLMHDPALHRVVHSLMKSTFMRLLSELQRLGCTIVYATFHRITIATNKVGLADAEEHVNFVISTVQRKCLDNEEQSSLARVALRPRQFHSHFLFLDEYNYGTLMLERHDKSMLEQGEYYLDEESNNGFVVVPSVVTAWSIMNYLGSDIAKEYFRIIVGRFSREALKKQVEIQNRNEAHAMMSVFCKDLREELLKFRQKMVSKHFATYLTRAVAEIVKDFNELGRNTMGAQNHVLEFIKSVMAVLELDHEVDAEVHVLKRSLLAQVGVAEYSSLAKWENPCPTFMLPDVFCGECRESRDLNLCYIPPSMSEDEGKHIHWFCDDCGTEYDAEDIERRLVKHVHQRMMRYQMQDMRCSKTNLVATRALSRVSACGADFKLDVSADAAENELRTLTKLARQHELDELYQVTTGILASFSR